MSGRNLMFRISEEDLAALESNLSLICREGMAWERMNSRKDIREAWAMTIKTLSDIRFDYGPPGEAYIVPTEQ